MVSVADSMVRLYGKRNGLVLAVDFSEREYGRKIIRRRQVQAESRKREKRDIGNMEYVRHGLFGHKAFGRAIIPHIFLIGCQKRVRVFAVRRPDRAEQLCFFVQKGGAGMHDVIISQFAVFVVCITEFRDGLKGAGKIPDKNGIKRKLFLLAQQKKIFDVKFRCKAERAWDLLCEVREDFFSFPCIEVNFGKICHALPFDKWITVISEGTKRRNGE